MSSSSVSGVHLQTEEKTSSGLDTTASSANSQSKNTESKVDTWFLRFCDYCEVKKVSFKVCGRCKTVRYCGLECQKQAWKTHKEVCSKLHWMGPDEALSIKNLFAAYNPGKSEYFPFVCLLQGANGEYLPLTRRFFTTITGMTFEKGNERVQAEVAAIALQVLQSTELGKPTLVGLSTMEEIEQNQLCTFYGGRVRPVRLGVRCEITYGETVINILPRQPEAYLGCFMVDGPPMLDIFQAPTVQDPTVQAPTEGPLQLGLVALETIKPGTLLTCGREQVTTSRLSARNFYTSKEALQRFKEEITLYLKKDISNEDLERALNLQTASSENGTISSKMQTARFINYILRRPQILLQLLCENCFTNWKIFFEKVNAFLQTQVSTDQDNEVLLKTSQYILTKHELLQNMSTEQKTY